jgi:hypothetical protein
MFGWTSRNSRSRSGGPASISAAKLMAIPRGALSNIPPSMNARPCGKYGFPGGGGGAARVGGFSVE